MSVTNTASANAPQLVVTVENASMLNNVKKAIMMLKGVTEIKVCKGKEVPNATTRKAIEAARNGELTYCSSFEDYLQKVQ